MRTTQRLYEAAHPIWEQCHDHPFVRGIGDGSLDLEKFRWFLLQDYLYLFDYARVFAYGVVKARDPGLMRTFSANVDAILGGEMKVHRAYMARLGITEEQVFSVQFVLYPLHALLCRRGRAGGDHRRHPLLLLELCGDRHALGGHPRRGGPPLLRRVDP